MTKKKGLRFVNSIILTVHFLRGRNELQGLWIWIDKKDLDCLQKEKSDTHNDGDRGREPVEECIGISTSVEMIGLNKSKSRRSTWKKKK
jgi:hypothetical protein